MTMQSPLKVDVLGTMALLAQDSSRPGVSVEINVTYMSAAKVSYQCSDHLFSELSFLTRFHERKYYKLDASLIVLAQVGSDIAVEGSVLKLGRSLGFTEVRLSDTMTGKLIAVGRHTKAFPQQS